MIKSCHGPRGQALATCPVIWRRSFGISWLVSGKHGMTRSASVVPCTIEQSCSTNCTHNPVYFSPFGFRHAMCYNIKITFRHIAIVISFTGVFFFFFFFFFLLLAAVHLSQRKPNLSIIVTQYADLKLRCRWFRSSNDSVCRQETCRKYSEMSKVRRVPKQKQHCETTQGLLEH